MALAEEKGGVAGDGFGVGEGNSTSEAWSMVKLSGKGEK